jgi:hypothetical protein
MARCADCNFNLEHHDERAGPADRCDRCNAAVCVHCGCTPNHPCIIECTDRPWMCGWREPGLCNFCAYQIVAEAYELATQQPIQQEQAGLVVLFG